MKTYQLILAAALVALAGCNKSNVENINAESNEIGFNAVARIATKANDAIVNDATYPTDNSFGIWGFNSPEGDWSEFGSSSTSNFMTGLEIKKTQGRDPEHHDLAWRNEDHYYYWPFTGAIAFIACHPFEVVPTVTYGGATISDYTISDSNKTIDLMFASGTGTRAANASTPVNLVFYHALSQIYFTIKTDADYTLDNVQFKVKKITFKNIDLSGDVTYNKSTIAWSDNGTQTENWEYYATAVEATAAGVAYGDAQVMIPQAANTLTDAVGEPGDEGYIPADEVQTILSIDYYMKQNTTVTEGTVEIAAPQAWAVNGKYNYVLNFKLNEILFNPTVNDWAELTVVSKLVDATTIL